MRRYSISNSTNWWSKQTCIGGEICEDGQESLICLKNIFACTYAVEAMHGLSGIVLRQQQVHFLFAVSQICN